MQTARYILFDFDGTLADTLDLAFTLYNRIAGEYGCEPLKPEDKQIIAGGRPQDLLREYNMPMKKLGLIVPDPYYLDKKVKMVELFSYHKLGLMNKYTHLFGDS